MSLNLLPAAQANAGLSAMFPAGTTFSMALATASPGTTGANEVANTGGSGYARQAIQFGGPVNGTASSTTAQTYTNMPSVTISYFALWSTDATPVYKGGGALTGVVTIPQGASITFAIGAISLTQGG